MKRPGRDLHPFSERAMQNMVRRSLREDGVWPIPSWDDAIAQASLMTDKELLRHRGIGPVLLAWIRSHSGLGADEIRRRIGAA